MAIWTRSGPRLQNTNRPCDTAKSWCFNHKSAEIFACSITATCFAQSTLKGIIFSWQLCFQFNCTICCGRNVKVMQIWLCAYLEAHSSPRLLTSSQTNGGEVWCHSPRCSQQLSLVWDFFLFLKVFVQVEHLIWFKTQCCDFLMLVTANTENLTDLPP